MKILAAFMSAIAMIVLCMVGILAANGCQDKFRDKETETSWEPGEF